MGFSRSFGHALCDLRPCIYIEQGGEGSNNIETDVLLKNRYLECQPIMWQQKVANHSERCSVNYKVEIARAVSVMFHSSDEFDIDAYIEFLGDTFYLLPHDLGTDVIPCVHGSFCTRCGQAC